MVQVGAEQFARLQRPEQTAGILRQAAERHNPSTASNDRAIARAMFAHAAGLQNLVAEIATASIEAVDMGRPDDARACSPSCETRPWAIRRPRPARQYTTRAGDLTEGHVDRASN